MSIPNKLRHKEINFVLLENGGKKPFQKDWQKKEIKWDDEELQTHLYKKGNYGVMGGGEKHLIIIDFDNEKLQEEIIKKLPTTFTVKTGSGLLHKYFWSNKSESFKIFDEEMNTLADIQGKGKQVVGPGSKHPNGTDYTITKNEDIAYLEYTEIEALLKPYDKKPKRKVEEKKTKPEEYTGEFLDDLKTRISFESLLSEFGVDTSKNPSNCPFHASKGGKCLGWTSEVAHCFHCDDSWNIFSWVKQNKNLGAKETIEWLAEREGLESELKKSREAWKKEQRTKNMGLLTNTKNQMEVFENSQPFFYDKNKIWWLWDEYDYRWELVDEVDILNMISNSCGTDVIRSKQRTETLNALKQEGRKNIPKPIKPTWIQFKNKIIDVMTGEEKKATPEYFITNPIPWKLGEYPDTPVMDRVFEEWVGKEYIQQLYEILAYCLIPDMPIHRIFTFIGEGLNGKSKYLELLRKFVGTENCCSTELDTLIQSRFEVTRLHKKLVCQMGETNFNEMSKTSIIKKLSGGDLIGFEYKNKNPFEEKNYAKIIIATNNLPSTSDKTMGFYRRWQIIDFPNSFNEKKDILAEIPKEEYENLALKSIVNLRKLLETREFDNEGTIEERMKRYEAKSNFLEKFIELFIIRDYDEDSFITKRDFHRKFTEWCKENKHRVLAEATVGRNMKKLGIESTRRSLDFQIEGKTIRAMVWEGLKWKN